MSVFVRATQAPLPKTKNVQTISLIVTGIFILLSVAQLFSFEKFPEVLKDMWLPGGDSNASVYAALFVTLEVFSVPFFLRMTLSPLMRFLSMLCGWIVIGAWLTVLLWQNLSSTVIVNSGLLGASVSIPTGWWSVFVMLGLGVLVGWVSWGLWGARTSQR